MKSFLRKVIYNPIISSLIAGVILSILTLLYKKTFSVWTLESTIIAILLIWIIFLIFVLLFQNYTHKKLMSFIFDREYKLVSLYYQYVLNPQKESLDLKIIGEREIKCITDQLTHATIGFSMAECFLEPEIVSEPELVKYEREHNRSVIIHKAHKVTKSNVMFRVEFKPALLRGETVYFKYKFAINNFKFGTREHLIESMKDSLIRQEKQEYNAFTINYPTQKFKYVIEFDKLCKINSVDIEANRFSEIFKEEDNLIKTGNKYLTLTPKDSNYTVELNREKPPLKTQYKVKWTPPSKNEIDT